MTLTFGATSVPWTVSWTGEEETSVAFCRFAGGLALCQAEAQGVGKPRFGKPHYVRQRQAIVEELCDLCGKLLKGRTKVSLSHARSRMNAVNAGDILQVEPLLHRECALASTRFCPSLKRDIASEALNVFQVTRYRVQFAIMGPQFIHHYVPSYRERVGDRIIGHAKVQLLDFVQRNLAWLSR